MTLGDKLRSDPSFRQGYYEGGRAALRGMLRCVDDLPNASPECKAINKRAAELALLAWEASAIVTEPRGPEK